MRLHHLSGHGRILRQAFIGWPGFLAIVALACTSAGGGSSEEGSTTDPSSTSNATTGPLSTSSDSSGGSTSGPAESATTGVADSTTGGEGSSTAVGTTTGGTTEGGSTGEPIDWDCDALVTPFIAEGVIDQAVGYHDVAFDQEGHAIGYDFSALLRVTYSGDLSVFVPGIGIDVQQMDWLENGDLLIVDILGALHRVAPDGQVSPVAAGLPGGAYGVTVGPDQMAYFSAESVYRIDPENGDVSEWLTLDATARAVVFNLDSPAAYIATLGFGDVYVVPLDADLNPSGPAEIFASDVGTGYHDGLGIDACGNLYVPDFNTSGLYRVDPAGVVTTLYDGPFEHYGHGLEWGSGIGGWNDHAIYLPLPYSNNGVNEIDLGVPSGDRVRTWSGRQ